MDFIVSLLLGAATFFGISALDTSAFGSATTYGGGITPTEQFLLALVALTIALLSGVAIKVARDAVQDVRDATKNVNEARDKIQKQQEDWELTQLRLIGTTNAVALNAHAAQFKDHMNVTIWEHVRDLYQAADLESLTFSASMLHHTLSLLSEYKEACRALTQTDHQFITELAKRLQKDHPEVAVTARELLRRSLQAR
jgi:hypothetical protein